METVGINMKILLVRSSSESIELLRVIVLLGDLVTTHCPKAPTTQSAIALWDTHRLYLSS